MPLSDEFVCWLDLKLFTNSGQNLSQVPPPPDPAVLIQENTEMYGGNTPVRRTTQSPSVNSQQN